MSETFSPLAPLRPGVHLVEASAGTGKTHQIGNLYLRLIAERGLSVEEILCVTFTRAATAELRERLRVRLREASITLSDVRARKRERESQDEVMQHLCQGSTEELSARIHRLDAALLDFDTASISTIHSFCQAALRAFAFEAGLELDRALVDAVPLLEEIVDDWVARRLHDMQPARAGQVQADAKLKRDDLIAVARTLIGAATPILRPDPPPDEATALRLELARFVLDELPRRLEARSSITFDELLRVLRGRLMDGSKEAAALASALRRRWRAALVDEFQDTDTAQWEIFSTIFSARGPEAPILYLIGDPKQAIYSFRGADVHVYQMATATADTRATMDENHRSDAAYVRALNAVFAGPNVFDLDFVRYVDVKARHPDRIVGMPALTFGWVTRASFGEPTPGDLPLDKATAWVRVPELVVDEVVKILHGGVTIAGRPVEPRDIAVLVRKHRQARSVHRALLSRGVPAVLGQSGSVFQSDEARSIERFLVAMETRGREQAVAALAMTPLFGRSAAEIKSLGRSYLAFVDRVAEWVQSFAREGFAPTFLRALDQEGVIARLVMLEDGERRITDLRHLVELLHAAALADHLGPAGLLSWLRRQRAGDEEDPDATRVRLESDARAVRVVTLHVSKGLQYPIVILPYLWDGAPLPPAEVGRLRYHDDDGRLVIDVSPTPADRDHELAKREYRREALRLTYVALTRAQHASVVMTGPFKQFSDSPLATILHAGNVGRLEHPESVRLRGELEALASRSGSAIVVRDLPATSRARYLGEPLDRAAPLPTARAFSRGRFDAFWRRVSYTTLTAGHELAAAPEGEDWDGDETEAKVEPVGEELALAAFPAGKEAGKLVHSILEHLDFKTQKERAAPFRPLAELVAHHGRAAGVGDVRAWSLLSDALPGVLATKLGPLGVSLEEVALADRLDELRFDLPLAGGDTRRGAFADGAALMAPMAARQELSPDYRRALGSLRIDRLAGFLTGSIDLVLRVAGRYYVIDYKTNRLGTRHDEVFRSTIGHYAEAAMRAEMERHHYHVQYHLYLVALHRWLSTRIPGYRYETHVGGAAYLFVRGMIGAETPDGHAVFVDAPSAECIETMSAALEGTR